jgi:hypothetical protein
MLRVRNFYLSGPAKRATGTVLKEYNRLLVASLDGGVEVFVGVEDVKHNFSVYWSNTTQDV